MSKNVTEMLSKSALERTEAEAEAGRPVLGYGQRVFREALARNGARVGLLWIALLVIGAVFGPFIANSHPIAMNVEGKWSSPMLEHLTATDVTLLFAFFLTIGVFLVLRGWNMLYRFAIIGGAVLVCFVIADATVKPSAAVVFDQYRVGLEAGEIDEALFAPIPYSPTDRLRDMESTIIDAGEAGQVIRGAALIEPGGDHLLGTDEDGSDVLSRMIHASRIALGIGFVATGIALVIGILYGGIMGFFSGWVDILMMRFLEIFQSIPQLILLLTIVAFFGRDLYLIMAVIGLTSWPGYARYLRAEYLKLRKQDFVQAAVACGLPTHSILFRHMLPNGVAPLLVAASFGIAQAILSEATLSFLGLGLVDEPSWGAMLNQAVGAGGTFTWWMATFPGLAIFLTVFAYNLLGEALRDAIDPHLKKAAV